MIFGKGGLEDEIKQAREQEHLNKYYAIHLDITSFITGVSDRDRIVDEMVARVIADIKGEFPDVRYSQWGTLMDVLLVGVNYDKKSKRHECRIERWGGVTKLASNHRPSHRPSVTFAFRYGW